MSLAKYILSVRTNNMAREPMGVGLFFYGVGEPVAHYTGNNKFYADPYLPGNLYPRAQPVSNLFNMMMPNSKTLTQIRLTMTFPMIP